MAVHIPLLGLGTALPAAAMDQSDAMAMALPRCCATDRQTRLLPALYRRTAVRQRHLAALQSGHNGSTRTTTDFYPVPRDASDRGPTTAARMADYDRKAAPLAANAAAAALDDGRIQPSAITHLVTCSCTGFSAPGVDVRLVEQLGLRRTTQRTHIGFMGCHGAFNALQVGRAIAAGEPDACVLVVTVELCSLHFSYGFEPQRIVANALFADGAAAAVMGHATPGTRGGGDSTETAPPLDLRGTGSYLLPDSADAMTWRIDDHGFVMTLSPRVPDCIARHLQPWLTDWLAEQGLAVGDVAHWAIHPGGPRVLEAVTDALELPRAAADPSRAVLAAHGNMSSATILFILRAMRAAERTGPIVALGFGPGLVAEAMLLNG